MKFQRSIVLLVFIGFACNRKEKTPPASKFIKLLTEQYTAGNNNDGGEFVTVDTLYILSTEPVSNGKWKVRYHVKVEYTNPPMPPGFEKTERPVLETDSSAILTLTGVE